MSKKKPLVVVLGCTGTGKSRLGIAIGKQFNGEIISADSMQIYKGLNIATNKVTSEEMDGIPHHMMSFVEPSTSTYNVHQFCNEACSLVEKLWCRGKLPVIVGGTGYYIEGILFKDSLIPTNTNDDFDDFKDLSDDELYQLLKNVDLESAMQIHKNNRFRVIRALQIYNATGQRKSDYIREQHRRLESEGISERMRYPNVLLFVLDADKKFLEEQLNARVSKMIEKGLRQEVESFYEQYRQHFTVHGVAQSIAVKEFRDYLQLDLNERYSDMGNKLFKEGCETLKLHTRQYSRRQRRWVKKHLLGENSLAESSNITFLDAAQSFQNVLLPTVLDKVEQFLSVVGDDVLLQHSNAPGKRRLFAVDVEYRKLANQIYHCEACNIDVQGTVCWEAHLKGKKHRKMMKISRKKRVDL